MSITNRFYPARRGDQGPWLTNWIDKIAGYQLILGYLVAEIAGNIADAQRILYLINTVQGESQKFAQSITAHVEIVLHGSGADLVPIPLFILPTTPLPPGNVKPGAEKRLLAFIANLKTRPGYNAAIGIDLQIVSSTTPSDPGAAPDPGAESKSGYVLLTFVKAGHPGMLIQYQVGASAVWADLAVCTSSPYHDVRPLAVPGQPEVRRYRFCFWDNVPSNVWSPVYEVTFGG